MDPISRFLNKVPSDSFFDLEDLEWDLPTEKPTGKRLMTEVIQFTQGTVSPFFSGGGSVAELAEKLAAGRVLPGAIPRIRVVEYQGTFFSLDNRRLRAFLDGKVKEIDVEMVQFSDSAVRREFWDKKTKKSVQGGKYRAPVPADFNDNPSYTFNKKVLGWTLEQLAQPMAAYLKNRIPDTFSDEETYYDTFIPLIYEEARATIQTGIEKEEKSPSKPLELVISAFRPARNFANPAEIKFSCLAIDESDLRPGDIFLIKCRKVPTLKLIVKVNFFPPGESVSEIAVKTILVEEVYNNHWSSFQASEQWDGVKLGSIMTLERMFEACSDKDLDPLDPILEGLLKGKTAYSQSTTPPTEEEKKFLNGLNTFQQEAILRVSQGAEGIHLIQGPPGTGKTTTIVQLIRLLHEEGKRVLVCAPSNKAVQVLGERLLRESPSISALLVGVEEKLPPESVLKAIFFDFLIGNRSRTLPEMVQKIQQLPTDKGKKQTIEKIKIQFASFVGRYARYAIPLLGDLKQRTDELESCLDALQGKETDPKKVEAACEILTSLQKTLTSERFVNELLASAKVVFSTLSVSGQKRLKTIGAFDIVIVDEAGQSTEAEALIPLRRKMKKAVFIGDIMQLPATVISQDAKDLLFGRSLMQRLIDACQQPFSMLEEQYRMHPEISRWPAAVYYGGRLKNGVSVSAKNYKMQNLPKFLAPYAFINIPGTESVGPKGTSFVNEKEVKTVAKIVNFLALTKGIDVQKKLSIITFYSAQVDALNDALKKRYPNLRINSVDGFQGDENDMIILSCVRANLDESIGFLKNGNRLNVAITRAKYSLTIVGNGPTLQRSDIADLVKDAKNRLLYHEQKVLKSLYSQKNKPQPPLPSSNLE